MIIDIYCPSNLHEYKISNRFVKQNWFCYYSYLKWTTQDGVAFDQKQNQVIISKHCLKRFKHNPKYSIERDLAQSNLCCK